MKMAPQLWSREVAFRPGRFVADRKQFTGDTGTAGYSLHLHLLSSSFFFFFLSLLFWGSPQSSQL
jgi:hypothetical protein